MGRPPELSNSAQLIPDEVDFDAHVRIATFHAGERPTCEGMMPPSIREQRNSGAL